MIFAHTGIALLLKYYKPKVSIWTCLFCSYLPDIVFYALYPYWWYYYVFLRTSIGYSRMGLTHSLMIWSAVIFVVIVAGAVKGSTEKSWIVGLAIMSHLFLDIFHTVPIQDRLYIDYPLSDLYLSVYIPYVEAFWLIDFGILTLGLLVFLCAIGYDKKEMFPEDQTFSGPLFKKIEEDLEENEKPEKDG